jgi:hypothetical protein
LRRLSDRHDRGLPRGRGETRRPSELFARLVAGRVEGGVLRYSARAQLIATAQALGLGRFEANLVIAAVQHHSNGSDTSPPPGASLFGGTGAPPVSQEISTPISRPDCNILYRCSVFHKESSTRDAAVSSTGGAPVPRKRAQLRRRWVPAVIAVILLQVTLLATIWCVFLSH